MSMALVCLPFGCVLKSKPLCFFYSATYPSTGNVALHLLLPLLLNLHLLVDLHLLLDLHLLSPLNLEAIFSPRTSLGILHSLLLASGGWNCQSKIFLKIFFSASNISVNFAKGEVMDSDFQDESDIVEVIISFFKSQF